MLLRPNVIARGQNGKVTYHFISLRASSIFLSLFLSRDLEMNAARFFSAGLFEFIGDIVLVFVPIFKWSILQCWVSREYKCMFVRIHIYICYIYMHGAQCQEHLSCGEAMLSNVARDNVAHFTFPHFLHFTHA